MGLNIDTALARASADTQFPREVSSPSQQKGERGDDQIEYVKRQTARFQTAAAEFRGCQRRPES
jgi:hypothetical protein